MNVKRPNDERSVELNPDVKRSKIEADSVKYRLPESLLRPPTPPEGESSSTKTTSTEDKPKPLPATKPPAFKMGFQKSKPASSISIQLKTTKKPQTTTVPTVPAKVAQLFNPESSSDEEEMPPEAKMKMKNIGRDTITSSGPYSYGKTKQGFVDNKKMFEKKLKAAMESVCDD